MARPTALLIAGGDAYHNTPEHYELLAGILAGPAGCNVTVTDDYAGLTREGLSGYDVLVLWATKKEPPAEPMLTLLDVVRRGKPLYGIHAAPYTMRFVEGGPAAIGCLYQPFPHLPYQEATVHILDQTHPITAGIEDFRIQDELYCLDDVGGDVHVLASYDGRAADAPYKGEPKPVHDESHAWRVQHPRAPLIYTKQHGAGKICVNALGHDGAALRNPAFRQITAQAIGWLTS